MDVARGMMPLTLDLDHLLHLWISLEHTLVLSAGAVGDLLQATTQMEELRTFGNSLAMTPNSSTRAPLMTHIRFPLSRVENLYSRAWGKESCGIITRPLLFRVSAVQPCLLSPMDRIEVR